MKPYLVGLTGGIGSGKSVVAEILKVIGFPVFDADKVASTILDRDESVKLSVIELLGGKAYLENGLPNRAFISSQVFNEPEKLKALNGLIHPAVQAEFLKWVDLNKTHKLLFKEAAIMFESGSYRQMDKIIAVSAPEMLRITRVMNRDQKSEELIKSIISKQMPTGELILKSDYVIENDENQLLIPQILAIIEKLLQVSNNDLSV